MGGIFTSYINGIDDRVKAAIIIAAAGQWQHAMRFPNSWLYDGLYSGTRDQPYNGRTRSIRSRTSTPIRRRSRSWTISIPSAMRRGSMPR